MSRSADENENLLGQLLKTDSKIDFTTSDKVTILLSIFEASNQTIQRREDREQKMFEWSTSLLLAAFAAMVALAGRAAPLPFPYAVKGIATVLITIPTGLFIYRINSSARGFLGSAHAIDRIGEALRLVEKGYYTEDSIYPERWSGHLSKRVLRRKTPKYYTAILVLMLLCVVASVWLLL
jgi:hypothetical protein